MGFVIITLAIVAIAAFITVLIVRRQRVEALYEPEYIPTPTTCRPTTIVYTPSTTRTIYVEQPVYIDNGPSLLETVVAAEIIEDIIQPDTSYSDSSSGSDSFDAGGGDFGGGGSDSSW